MTSLNDLSLLSKESDQQFEAGYPLELEAVTNPRVQVVSHLSRYAATVAVLPAAERQKIDQIARFIAGGLRSGRESIRTVRLTGHADLDTPRRPAFEYQVARARAQDVLAALAQALDRIERTTGRAVPPYSSRIAWEVPSAGATRLVVPNPRTELDRARNRRVEISLLPYESSLPQSVSMRGPKFALTTRSSIDDSVGAAIDDFLRRAPNDALRYNDPDFGQDLADRRICVSAVASKAAQLCSSANAADRGGIPCRGAPLTGATRVNCCTKGFPCSPKTLSALPAGQYLVLKYQPGPLKELVDRLKCLLDRGCVVPVGVLSGIGDDKPDLSGICKSIPLQNKWRDCWEHWLLIIGYDGDRFVFWDSAEASIVGPVRCGKDDHYFDFLYYHSSGFHTQGVPRSHAQKRYQVTSMWNGLPWKPSGAPCSLT